MRCFDLVWKCWVCGMHGSKEPHRSLSDHMEVSHGMVWSAEQDEYVAKQPDQKPIDKKPIESSDSSARLHYMLHRLWSSCVDKLGYDKQA